MKKKVISFDRKIRVAIVGCGRIAKKHFEAINSHDENLELVSLCDIDTNCLESNNKKLALPTYLDLDEMMKTEDLDLVVLCTPSGLHAQQTELVAQYGVNVVTEKPMATNWHDGLRMVKACDKADVRLFVVKQNRHNKTLQVLKKAIEKNRFGRIYMVNINVFWTRPQEYYDSAKWRGTWEFDGGALMNQASHYVDLLDWLIGPIESLQAYTATLERNIQVEDTGVVSIKWRSGALGSLNVSMLTFPKNLEGSITILGKNGTVKIGGVAVNEIQHWEFLEEDLEDVNIKATNYETTSVYGFGHTLYYENVVNVMRGISEPKTDGREGLRSLEVLVATYLSARGGKRISLPLDS